MPAYPWRVDGTWTGIPASYVAAAQQRIPRNIINLERLRLQLFLVLAKAAAAEEGTK